MLERVSFIDDIKQEMKEDLKKYEYKNERKRNVKKYSFFKDEEDIERTETKKPSYIQKDTQKEIKTETYKKEESINFDIKQNISEDVFENKKEITNNEVVNNEESEYTQSVRNFVGFMNKKKRENDIEKAQSKELDNYEKMTKREKKEIVISTFEYIFDTFYNYSLVFDEFKSLINNFPSLYTPVINKKMEKVDGKNFIFKLRTVSLIQKINLLAYLIGKYNFNFIVKEIVDIDVFNEELPEDFAIRISKEYDYSEDNNLNFIALYRLWQVIEDEKNGKINIEDLVAKQKKEENKQEIKTFEEKKQKRKSLLGMDSFSLRKK